MATSRIVLNVLDVGQGQGTFVEVYDTYSNITNTLLFDLGSAKSKQAAGGASVDYIADKVVSMASPKIDYLSLSHKDRDHVNLIVDLITKIIAKATAVGKTFSIGKVRFGGALDWYSGTLMTELNKICADVNNLQMSHTCYLGNDTWDPIWNENDVYAYIILANIPSPGMGTATTFDPSKPDSELANCVSIISSVWYQGTQFFILGDATFVTMQESNKLFNFLPNFNNPSMVTLPHHGSRKTTFGLSASTADASKESLEVVNTFAKKIGAKTVAASAEIYGNYHHPSYDVIKLFIQYAETTPLTHDSNLSGNRHYITAYLDTAFTDSAGQSLSEQYTSFETDTNIYTTLYCDPNHIGTFSAPPTNPVGSGTTWNPPSTRPAFPVGVRWSYLLSSQGVLGLEPNSNRTLTTSTVANAEAKTSKVEGQVQIKSKAKSTSIKPPAGMGGGILSKKIKLVVS